MIDTAPALIHRAAGQPPHKYTEEPHEGVCATCATPIPQGVDTTQVNNPTFSNHAEFFKFGTHVCRACAWMYSDPKRTHRNVLVAGEELWWPMISVESATEERPSWAGLLGLIHEESEDYLPDTPVTGVLTTDPKPRMWPRCRVASVGSFGLYVHAPDYDVSEWRSLDLGALRETSRAIREPLLMGFAKSRIYHGLLGDYARAKKDIEGVMRLEMRLREARGSPEFIPALLVTGVTKEEKATWKGQHLNDGNKNTGNAAGHTGRPDGRGEARGTARENDARLF